MSAYTLVDELRACGFEATLCAWHCEADSLATGVLWDSCLVVALGGVKYPPKMNTSMAHALAATRCPNYRGPNGGLTRGYPSHSYLTQSTFPVAPDLQNDTKARGLVLERRVHTLTAQSSEDLAVFESELMNERTNEQADEAVERSDPRYRFTRHFPVHDTLKAFMARPELFDPTGRQWSSAAHWPLWVTVGTKRGRSSFAHKERNARPQAQKGIQKATAKAARKGKGKGKEAPWSASGSREQPWLAHALWRR